MIYVRAIITSQKGSQNRPLGCGHFRRFLLRYHAQEIPARCRSGNHQINLYEVGAFIRGYVPAPVRQERIAGAAGNLSTDHPHVEFMRHCKDFF